MYSTGPDNIPLTADDFVTGYWTNIYKIGGIWGYGSGPDGIWFTADDALDHSSRWDTHPERTFSNRGPDGIWMTEDDLQSGYYKDTYDVYGDITERIRYSDKGTDGVWNTADDIPGQDWYEIYWKASYDGDKQVRRRPRRHYVHCR